MAGYLGFENALPHLIQKDLAKGGFENPHFPQIHERPLVVYVRILGTTTLKADKTTSAATNNSPHALARIVMFSVSVLTTVDVVRLIVVIEFSTILLVTSVCVRY